MTIDLDPADRCPLESPACDGFCTTRGECVPVGTECASTCRLEATAPEPALEVDWPESPYLAELGAAPLPARGTRDVEVAEVRDNLLVLSDAEGYEYRITLRALDAAEIPVLPSERIVLRMCFDLSEGHSIHHSFVELFAPDGTFLYGGSSDGYHHLTRCLPTLLRAMGRSRTRCAPHVDDALSGLGPMRLVVPLTFTAPDGERVVVDRGSSVDIAVDGSSATIEALESLVYVHERSSHDADAHLALQALGRPSP